VPYVLVEIILNYFYRFNIQKKNRFLNPTDSDDYVEDIMRIEQHKYHPKENYVEYYSNHTIYKNGEHKPRKFKIINN